MHRILILTFLVLTNSIFGGSVEDGLKQLSWHERACMKAFFDEAINFDQASHVLFFDNKPVCLTSCLLKSKYKRHNDILSLKGWRMFKKHEHLFPHPDFIIDENIVEFDKFFKVLHIYIINKHALVNCLEAHAGLFREFLGQSFTPEQFLAELEKGCSLPELLNGNEFLIGVLLGYGEESARAFYEAHKGHSRDYDYAPPQTETYCAIELDRLSGCKIEPVVFMGNPNSSEVHQLKSIYESELKEIWQTYRSIRNRLWMTLKALCSE